MSSEVVRLTDPEQLPRAAAALGRQAESLERVAHGVTVACRRIEDQARDAVVQLEGRLAAAEARLRSVHPEDEAGRRQAEAALLAASRAVTEARGRRDRVLQVLAELSRSTTREVATARGLAEQGRRALSRFWERLGRAAASFSAAVAHHRAAGGPPDPAALTGGRGGGGGPGGAARWHERLDDVAGEVVEHMVDGVVDDMVDGVVDGFDEPPYPGIGDNGRVLVPVDDLVDPAPVTGAADFVKLSVADMQAGLQLLEDRVLPALQRGEGRERMRRLDEDAGTVGSPAGFLAVYDAFFGGEERAVRAHRRPDGRLEVDAGRHRVWLARRMHLDALPVLLRGAP